MNIQSVIDGAIKKGREASKKDHLNWYLSSLGSCLSGVYFTRLHNGAAFTERQLRIFEMGNLIEDFAVKHLTGLEEEGWTIEKQVRVANRELDVSGRIDVLLRRGEEKVILEFKSIRSDAFHYNDLPYPHHVKQITSYQHFLFGPDPNVKLRLVYVSKDDLLINEYPVRYEPETVKEILRELTLLNEAWTKKTRPGGAANYIFDQTKNKWVINWKARFCPFHHLCTGNDHWLEEAKVKVKSLNRSL